MNNKPTVLILGASGLLGFHCQQEMEKLGFKVIKTFNTCKLDLPYSEKLDVLTDVSKINDLLLKYRPNAIINNIAYVTVDGCEANPVLAEKLNYKFVSDLVSALKSTNLDQCHLIHVSSDSVYGDRIDSNDETPWMETDKTNPLSVYAKTKLQGEGAALQWKKTTVLRTAFYGINPYSTKSLLWWIIDNAKKGNVLEGWENIFFSPVSAKTLSLTMIEMISRGILGLYNVGSIDICNKYDFVSYVCEKLNLNAKVDRVSKPAIVDGHPIRPNFSVLNSSKLAKTIPWNLTWREDLSDYMKNMPSFPK